MHVHFELYSVYRLACWHLKLSSLSYVLLITSTDHLKLLLGMIIILYVPYKHLMTEIKVTGLGKYYHYSQIVFLFS